MKTFLKILIICNILVLATLSSKGQDKDYVITTQGDKLACTITNPVFVPNGKYKTAEMERPREILISEIKEYYISKSRILHRKVLQRPGKAGSAIFMVVLENGKINLYEEVTFTTYGNSGPNGAMYLSSSNISTWYISKGSDTLKELKDLDFFTSRESRENELVEMIKDNKYAYDKYMADHNFRSKQVRILIHLYNTGKPFRLSAGKDYVAKKNKDTIFCEIEPASSTGPGRYKVNAKDKFIKIDTAIKAYFLYKDSSTFLLKILPGDKRPKYVKCLVKGKINLYAYSLNNSAADSEASLYASKEQGDLVLLKDEFHRPGKIEKKAFGDLISGNPNLLEKFINLPYNFTSVLAWIKTYNSN